MFSTTPGGTEGIKNSERKILGPLKTNEDKFSHRKNEYVYKMKK